MHTEYTNSTKINSHSPLSGSCNPNSRTLRVTLAVLVCGLATSITSAQDALGDGTGLANPLDLYQRQFHSETRTQQFQRENLFREAIVTGRAAGGASFRGDVGYGMGSEFRGQLGSDSIYAFQRDSALSGAASQGVSGAQALQFQFALSTGAALPQGVSGAGVVSRSGGGWSTGGARGMSVPGSTLAAIRFADSPIQGTRLENRSLEEMAAAGEGLRTEARDLRSLSGMVGHRSFEPASIQTIDGGFGRPSFDVLASPTVGLRTRPIDSPLVMGSLRLENAMSSQALDTSPGALSAINRLIVRRPGEALQPVPVDPAVPTDPADPALLPGELPDGQLPTDAPIPGTDRFMLDPERLQSIRNWLAGLEPEPTPEGEPEQPVLSPEEIEAFREAGEVADLVERRSGLEADAAYAMHMSRGQTLLAERRYFDAEERFVSALSIRRGDPTAMIGRVHAQLGAGLMLSASMNLRQLLAEHPELVGVRYAPELLPDGRRVDLLIAELGTPRDMPQSSVGLLRAYVGFQTSDQELIESGLEQLQTGDKSDQALASLLRAVWVVSESP